MRDVLGFVAKYLYAACSCLYLFSIGVFRGRNRPVISRLCSHFGYPRRYLIPEMSVDEIVAGGEISVSDPVGINGSVSLLETVVLANLLRKHKPESIFEFGTFNGRTTLNIAANTGADAKIYTLDLPSGCAVGSVLPPAPAEGALKTGRVTGGKFLGTVYGKKITQLYGDSAVFDFTPFKGRMDFVFVDASHSYEYVLNDSRKALELLGDGSGVIVWHDYGTEGWEGVITALDKLYSGGGVFAGMRRISGTTLVVLTQKALDSRQG